MSATVPLPDFTRDLSGFPDFCLHIPPEAHRLAGFRAWVFSDEFPEDLPATFYNGQVYLDMSTQAVQTHLAVKVEVYGVLNYLNKEIDFGELYPDGLRISNLAANVSNNPDGVAVLWRTLKSGRARFVAKKGTELELVGTPDWAMEIVSDASVFKDTHQLREAYHKAEIPECWLIDARAEEIDFQMLLWRKSGYVAVPHKDGWQRSRVFGRSFRLTRSRNRRGAWKYSLELKQD